MSRFFKASTKITRSHDGLKLFVELATYLNSEIRALESGDTMRVTYNDARIGEIGYFEIVPVAKRPPEIGVKKEHESLFTIIKEGLRSYWKKSI